jgi:aminodeoxyfutalosine deaminase
MNMSGPRVEFIRCFNRDSLGKRSVHRAGWVLINPYEIIENGCVEVENGVIIDVYEASLQNRTGQKTIDHGPGVIMPCLVNAHLHLELSALKNTLSFDHGFPAWVRQLLEKRDAAGQIVLASEAQRAARKLIDQGTGYIGEISTLGLTREIVRNSGLLGVWFQEVLGSFRPETRVEKKEFLSFSLAGHAPHTTDPSLLQAVKQQTGAQNLPFSIHLAESDAESQFISGEKGEWGDFLASRGIDTSLWPIGSKSPVQYLDHLGVLDSSTLAVHLLNIDPVDLDILARTRTRICLCPRSNYNLHKRLPNIGKLLEKKLAPALGSDSLASCDSLSIFDEMGFVRRKYPHIDPGQILAMATINGARALGLSHLAGTLDKGKNAAFIYVDISVQNKSELMEHLILHET